MAYRQPIVFGDARLTAFPAGHCLGSAMLLAEDGRRSLLYTGDFKLRASATAQPAELPCADVLVMECTFGRPRYRLPPRDEVVGELVALVQRTLAEGATPVVHAYALGKAQEATRLLTDAGTPVLQHPAIYEISRIYQQCGVNLGDVRPYRSELLPGRAVVTLPKTTGRFRLPGIDRAVTMAVTGWAVDPSTKFRWDVDYALPLSDHADFDELIEAVRRVGPSEVYCTHGPREFVDHLRERGFCARPVAGDYQTRLF